MFRRKLWHEGGLFFCCKNYTHTSPSVRQKEGFVLIWQKQKNVVWTVTHGDQCANCQCKKLPNKVSACSSSPPHKTNRWRSLVEVFCSVFIYLKIRRLKIEAQQGLFGTYSVWYTRVCCSMPSHQNDNTKVPNPNCLDSCSSCCLNNKFHLQNKHRQTMEEKKDKQIHWQVTIEKGTTLQACWWILSSLPITPDRALCLGIFVFRPSIFCPRACCFALSTCVEKKNLLVVFHLSMADAVNGIVWTPCCQCQRAKGCWQIANRTCITFAKAQRSLNPTLLMTNVKKLVVSFGVCFFIPRSSCHH